MKQLDMGELAFKLADQIHKAQHIAELAQQELEKLSKEIKQEAERWDRFAKSLPK